MTLLAVEPMSRDDLSDVLAIEQASFPTPWTEEHFRHEIEGNAHAINLVLRDEDRVVAYLCAYLVAGELQINDLAVAPNHRGLGLGGRLLDHILAIARARQSRSASLEVRPSNAVALRLYASRGFAEVGRRAKYYAECGEDALLLGRAL